MEKNVIERVNAGLQTAFIDGNVASNVAYRPQFLSNDYHEGKKVLSSIEDELLDCDRFQISVAFVTLGGITPLLQTFKELEAKGIPGEILTTNYLNFSEPEALDKLNSLNNIRIRMYDVEASGEGFHTKGYIFKKEELYRIIIGSSNMTAMALTCNKEWNTRIVSTEDGEYAHQVVAEYKQIWNSPYTKDYEEFIDEYRTRYNIIKHQREIAKKEETPSVEKYKLSPNRMQVGFIANLKKIVEKNEHRALLISATGTGKTYASAFAMRELGYKRVLFLVHRGELATQTMKSYKKVFDDKVTMGILGNGHYDYDADYVFAMVQTLNREEHLKHYRPDDFDAIIIDEAHHSPAESYQNIMKKFTPKLWLGMTATPDKRDDNIEGRNVYKTFNHQIAYEIRLQQAMEEDMLCPFHYFGIHDIEVLDEKTLLSNKLSEKDFNFLTRDERIDRIVEQALYYGYSGDRVKGLVFCSRVDESRRLSDEFNKRGFRTMALNGDADSKERQKAFYRLAMNEEDATEDCQPLDYIFSVDILNEGVDIVEVNQVIMLRPTQSPIVFIQQLGRGLRKAAGKEYVVVLDFIGNYTNNFMIPIALSGDRSYNKDSMRKYVQGGTRVIPGSSTVHFDEVSRSNIFKAIDKMNTTGRMLVGKYMELKDKIGHIPTILDFYE